MKFNWENPVFDYLQTLFAFIGLNLVFLLTCLPIITAGPACAALYQVTLREARKEYGYLIRPYLRSFRELLGKGCLLLLYYGAILLIALFAVLFWDSMDTAFSAAAAAFTGAAGLLICLPAEWAFPMAARFENSTVQILKNAYALVLMKPFYTALLLFIDAAAVTLFIFFAAFRIFLLIVGFAFLSYAKALIITHVFEGIEEDHNP